MQNTDHIRRIKQELKDAGVSRYGLAKMESKYLPSIIHEDEHIKGVVYGKIDFLSSMLIATDRRILYINREPMVSTMDEVTYDMVGGVKFNKAGLFGSITLHTRIQDYVIRYVNIKSGQKFIKYLESRRIESVANAGNGLRSTRTDTPPSALQPEPEIDKEALDFLRQLDLAVLSTVDRYGVVKGAVINYTVGTDNLIYIMTKSDTAKAKGVYAHGQVALTVHEPGSLKTVQVEGTAELEQDPATKQKVFKLFTSPKNYKEGKHLPPVTKLVFGSYVVIRITPTFMRYRDYSIGKE